MLPNEHADGHISGTVLKRATDRIGNNLGRKHELPALDSRMYVVKLQRMALNENYNTTSLHKTSSLSATLKDDNTYYLMRYVM